MLDRFLDARDCEGVNSFIRIRRNHNDVYLFDFLFAAQDASTSSLLGAVTLLDSHPEVLAKVCEEVELIWLPESDSLITGDQIVEMKYTHAVAREILRYRAPTPLVPHIAAKDFPLNELYTIPKETIVLTTCEGF